MYILEPCNNCSQYTLFTMIPTIFTRAFFQLYLSKSLQINDVSETKGQTK